MLRPHQRLCEQLRPVLRRELERFQPLAGTFAECEVELCSLAFSHWTDTTDVSIRPLVPQTAAAGGEGGEEEVNMMLTSNTKIILQ